MESEDTYISSRPFKQKYKRQFEFISVCVCGCEGAQSCLFEPYDSELTELGY